MRKYLLLLIVVPFLSFNIINDKNKFIGKWVGDDQYEIGYINFDDEGYAYFEIEGQIIGGKEFVFDGKKGRMTYEINSNVDPIEIDLIITKLESGEQKKLFCIASFIDDDSMKFAIDFETRPDGFNSENSIIFKRQK